PSTGRLYEVAPCAAGPHLLTLSARSAPALRAAASALAAHLGNHPQLDEADVCAAASTARDDGPHRLALVAEGDLAEQLAAVSGTTEVTSRPRVVFLLPGQGAQRPGQGRALYATAPVFRHTLDEASASAGPVRGRSLTEWCLDTDVSTRELRATEVAQPLLVAFGVALARQLGAWGVHPDAVAGHSVGELAAACVAGALTLPDAVRFAVSRGRLMAELAAPGAMAAVRGGEETVEALLAASDGRLSLAAANGPAQTVLAGDEEAIASALEKLAEQGVAARRLDVSHAFHSPLMVPALDPLAAAAGALTPRPTRMPLMSTVTARWQPVLDPPYLREQALLPVRFGAAVERLLDEGYDTFLELGTGAALSGPVRAVAARREPAARAHASAALPADPGADGGTGALLRTAGRLWMRGVPLDRTALDAGRSRVVLPTYPFQRRTYWPTDTAEGGPQYGAEAAAAAGGDRRAERHADAEDRTDTEEHGRTGTEEHGRPDPWNLLHRPVWRLSPAPSGPEPRAVLLAGPDSQWSRTLAERLTARGVAVHRPGGAPPAAGAPAPRTIVLPAGPATDLDTTADLDAAVHSALARLRELLDLLDLLGPPGPLGPRDPAGLPGLPGGTPAARVLVVTEDVHAAGASPERPRPAQALLSGLTLALPEETPGLVADSIDLSSLDTVTDHVGALLAELAAPRAGGPARTIAWRGGRRLIRTTEPVTPGSGSPGLPAPCPENVLPADGAYLITGGAGGVGAVLARDLAGRGRPTLVLAGRSPQPPEALLAGLRALGATASYVRADVSVEADADALAGRVPLLDAVFHAAGVVRPGTLRTKTGEEIEQVLAAKTRGTYLLSRALRRHGHRPAACVAFSSVSSVLPGLAGAIGDYAAANAFLDAFAAAERAAGRPWQSLNFAAFAGAGLAAGTAGRGAPGLRGPAPLATGAAPAALRAALTVDAAQLVVADLPGEG
ncbi:SDR family NAD(P)-dependent oxidoreductase, partial [Streptomyces sp. GC420]|uniref:SDR family NAD(P)-dependent oxidoreductase n=1 Tax=Streptomyces sp. GC420 TaxID=2697568 RepID=UPI001414F9E3